MKKLPRIKFAKQVLETAFDGGAHLIYDGRFFMYFNVTHWVELSEAQIGGIILHFLSAEGSGFECSSATVRETIEFLKMTSATGPDASFNELRLIINVNNGELWLLEDGSVQLRDHNPASRQRHCLAVNYDPEAQCPLYDNALTEIFSRSKSAAELVAIWHEITGYTLQPSRPDARIIVGVGSGGDGKSAAVGTLVSLLGTQQVAAMPIGELTSNRFMMGHLEGKRLLLDDDVTADSILPDGVLKKLSEQKLVTGEQKYRNATEFQVRALPLLLCNSVIQLRDLSDGFRRRLIVIPFDRQFTEDEADRTLFGRIQEAEMSGVLNRALAGLQRVVQRGWKFAPPDAVREATEQWWADATNQTGEGIGSRTSNARGARRTRQMNAARGVNVFRPTVPFSDLPLTIGVSQGAWNVNIAISTSRGPAS